jgi:hypothetical protein
MSMFKKEGEQLKFRDTGQPVRLFLVENFGFAHYPNNGEMIKFIDAVANNGANGIRAFGFFPFGRGHEEEPYVRSGGKFDLNRINLSFFNHLRQWVGYAQQRGVAVLYELFDSVGLKYPQLAPYHPFGEFTRGDLRAFSDLSNHRLVTAQKKYLDDVVNVLKQFSNVIFAIMNEFDFDDNWHCEMSHYVKSLAPQHLIAGSAERSPATGDPNIDIWSSHCGTYDKDRCCSNLAHDLGEFRPRVRGKIVGYSTDGFGLKGMKCENPDAMRSLAQDAKNQNLQIFSFLDHNAYIDLDDSGKEYPVGTWYRQEHVYELSRASLANAATYRAIAEAFSPTPLVAPEPIELPEGVLQVFDATYLDSTHPDVRTEKGGKAIAATKTQGYLCRTPQISGLPEKPLEVCFSIFVDNNTYDDAIILILDVYDALKKEVIAIKTLPRKQFPKSQTFNLIKLPFRPPKEAQLEFRVYYFGYAYVAVDKMAVIEPDKISLQDPTDIPDLHSPIPSPSPGPDPSPSPEPTPTPESKEGLVEVFNVSNLHSNHPGVFPDKGGKAIMATTEQGFLAFGQYVTGYPSKTLDVYFSVFIDNNTADNRRILTLDVYDSFQNKLLTSAFITRKQFPVAGAFSLFKLSFTPVEQSRLEFRICYNGWAYVAADKIAVVDPEKIQLKNHDDMLALVPTPSIVETEEPTFILPGGAIVAESLKDGRTAGNIKDGNLTAEGLQLRGGEGSISYKIPTTPRGFIEFSARGFVQDELHGGSEYKGVLVTMWDEAAGYNYDRSFIFELRKYGYIEGRRDASNTLWFKIKSNGEWSENPRTGLSWDPNATYRFRLEWGGGQTRILRDGQETARGVYRAEFSPPVHRIQIGANMARGRKCPYDLLISDVVIGKA